MGFRPSLRRTEAPFTEEAEYIASEHSMMKRVGGTLDSTTVGADADGNKILKKGTVLAYVDADDKFRAYLNSLAADAGGTAYGFLHETVNLKDGDLVVGILIHGSVLEARCSGLDSNAKTDLAGRIVFQ